MPATTAGMTVLPPSFQPPHDIVELIEAAITDADRTAALTMINADRETKRISKALFQCERVGVFCCAGARFAASLTGFAGDLLDLAHIEAARHDFVRQPLRIVMADQSARVTGAEAAGMDVLLDTIGQRLKPQRIGNMAAAFADHAGDIVLAMAEIAD